MYYDLSQGTQDIFVLVLFFVVLENCVCAFIECLDINAYRGYCEEGVFLGG